MPLLDADQLTRDSPTSFICASCSLPLIQSSKVEKYKDLPSEHWQELVDAWMCHSDQKLHAQVAMHSRGFWPEKGQALVGGSYILLEESCMVKNNLCPADENKASFVLLRSQRTFKKTSVGLHTSGRFFYRLLSVLRNRFGWFWCSVGSIERGNFWLIQHVQEQYFTRSNNSRLNEVHVSGATFENTFFFLI